MGISKSKMEELSTIFTKTKNFKKNMKNKAKFDKKLEKDIKPEFKSKENAAELELKDQLFKEEMGLSLIISALLRSKKAIIGHNFIYDLGFLYHQFIDDLPETYQLFKSRVHDSFPEIYDTKVIAHCCTNGFSHFDMEHVLKKAIELNKGVVKFEFPKEFRNLEEVKEGHDAGFDSFCAGKAFTIMGKLLELGIIKGNPFSHKGDIDGSEEIKSVEIKVEKTLPEVKQAENNNTATNCVHVTKLEEKKMTKEDEAKAKLAAMLASMKHGTAANQAKK